MRGKIALNAFVAALALAITAFSAGAQQSVRVRGEIERVEAGTLAVRSREGEQLSVKLADDVTVLALIKAALSDIKPGSFVGISAIPGESGMLRALEVHIFPEAMRGTGEGHRPWDLMPESTMTNATVAETVTQVDGQVLTMKYKDGEQKVLVAADTPIVTYVSTTRDELKAGSKIFISTATRQPDGTLQAARVSVGRDLAPPM